MTLYELSMEYWETAAVLKERLDQVRRLESAAPSEAERIRLHDRARVLAAMWRDVREVALLTEHYYERRWRGGGRIL